MRPRNYFLFIVTPAITIWVSTVLVILLRPRIAPRIAPRIDAFGGWPEGTFMGRSYELVIFGLTALTIVASVTALCVGPDVNWKYVKPPKAQRRNDKMLARAEKVRTELNYFLDK